ncbi:CPBP family intramembrane glutamic endopeptidase [Nocardiopsis baichengensis]|uniref:CPBP family intramembrane glutamic endopeptidase n=1 Tax=Nocardiopsis baichengensis TaxID=280240 RepID=UPI00034BA896|nr:CPBP family intramembrane glutamic endopeptidase [Nocardiopsis baichengensis]
MTSKQIDAPAHRRPGWPEIAVGLLAMVAATVVLLLLGPLGGPLDPDSLAYGLAVTAWSGVAGIAGFAAAAAVRIRSWAAFGVRRTSWRWMAAGVAAGLFVLGAKTVVNSVIVALTDFGETDPQGVFHDAAGGGVLPLVLTFLFLAVLTPIGEELLFRGVVTNALLRYGPVVGVVAGSVLFAVYHGVNFVLPSALIVGLVCAELMRRSGSVWPGVVVHAVNNSALPVYVMLS